MRIKTLTGLGLTAVLMATAGPAAADFPEREITVVVPFGAGGATDIVARIITEAMSERLGVPIIIDNRGGAGGVVGTQAAARMAPDGYALALASTSSHVIGPLRADGPIYDPLEDFAPVGLFGETPTVLAVYPGLGVSSVGELIAMMEAAPGDLNLGTAGHGSSSHLAALRFMVDTGTEMEHIPFSSSAESVTALMGNEVQVMFGAVPGVLAQIEAGSVLPLGVGTAGRASSLPEVPTLEEAGVDGYRASLWFGLAAPAGTPEDRIAILAEALADSVADPAVVERLAASGAETVGMGPEEFRALIVSELEAYGELVDLLD